jgi:hypothetical protein
MQKGLPINEGKGVKFYDVPTEQMWGIEVVVEDLYGNLFVWFNGLKVKKRKSLTQPRNLAINQGD